MAFITFPLTTLTADLWDCILCKKNWLRGPKVGLMLLALNLPWAQKAQAQFYFSNELHHIMAQENTIQYRPQSSVNCSIWRLRATVSLLNKSLKKSLKIGLSWATLLHCKNILSGKSNFENVHAALVQVWKPVKKFRCRKKLRPPPVCYWVEQLCHQQINFDRKSCPKFKVSGVLKKVVLIQSNVQSHLVKV